MACLGSWWPRILDISELIGFKRSDVQASHAHRARVFAGGGTMGANSSAPGVGGGMDDGARAGTKMQLQQQQAVAAGCGGGPSSPGPYHCINSRSDGKIGDQSSSTREKKKKMTGFATLRRKLIRRRRSSKSFDHGKIVREFVADWSPLELNALVEEYEVTAALKDLSTQADLARPPASTHKQDLSDLFDYKYATDVTLVFQGACFPAHRAILSSRCSYFRDLLGGVGGARSGVSPPTVGLQVHVDSLQSRGIDIPTFASLLRFLYTGDLVGDCERDVTNLEGLLRLGKEFGTPNQLEHDLRYLMETGDMADAVMVFASGQDFVMAGAPRAVAGAAAAASGASSSSSAGEYGFFPWLEIPCHRAILSARSPFFRSLIQRRCNATYPCGGSAPPGPTRIVLDESVIPRRYARILMQALYLDSVDLNCIVRTNCASSQLQQHQQQQPSADQDDCGMANRPTCGTGSASVASSSSAAPGSSAGGGGGGGVGGVSGAANRTTSLFDEATELYQIGRFLELDILSQGCEDVLVDNLCLDNVASVLRWSQLPHGSPWVRRQALQLLREEFASVAQASVLLELDKMHLVDALQSDFLQSSELEVLQAVLRWGEHQLVKRMEQREPNIVSQTAHSVARKGVRRRDLNDVELRDILSELLPHVRVDHILPPNHETLSQAIRRGLVSTPPSHMIGGDKMMGAERGEQLRLHAWIRGKNNGLYVKPRLFMPYFEEAKSLLADQLVQEMELVRLRMVRMSSHIPDTLYMIDNTPPLMAPHSAAAVLGVPARCAAAGVMAGGAATGAVAGAASDLDVVTGAVPVPDSETLQAMVRRERKLRMSPLSQRAYSLPLASRRDINRQIRLRVVREFNLPDSIAEVLESAAYQFAEEADDSQPAQPHQTQHVWEQRKLTPLAVRVPLPPKRNSATPARNRHDQACGDLELASSLQALDLPLDDDDPRMQRHQSQLSEFIPDIALATASLATASLGDVGGGGAASHPHFAAPLHPPETYRELQLDLGDGAGSARLSTEWSTMVRTTAAGAHTPLLQPHAASGVRLSTFRSEENVADHWSGTASRRPSPRSQRRGRPSRAADIRVFI